MRRLRWLASRKAQRSAIVLSILVTLPALSAGFMNDDFLQRLALEGHARGYTLSAHELYDFTQGEPPDRMIDRGWAPWFTHPDWEVRFFRPIAGLSLGLDAIFGRNALVAHLQSLFWLIACVAAVASVERRALRPSTAAIATAIYGIAGAHAMTTVFIAARHTLIAATFGAIAIAAHLAWRDRHCVPRSSLRSLARADSTRARFAPRSIRAALIAPAAIALALLTSEAGLGAVVFIVLYEAIVARGAIGRRIGSAMPATLIALAYLTFYALARYGTRHSGAYISPFDDPLAFAGAILERTPMLLAELYGGAPSDLSAVDQLKTPFVVYGTLTTIACALLLWRAKLSIPSRRRVIWLGVSSIVSLVPMVGGVIGGRLLPIALIGSSAIVATAIVAAWRSVSGSKVSRIGLRAGASAVALLHFGLSPLVRVSQPPFMGAIGRAEERWAREADLGACADRELMYVVSGSDPVNSLYSLPLLLFYTPEKVARISRIRVLSMAPHGQSLTVVGPDRFELRVLGDARVANTFERVYRDTPPEVGEHIRSGELGTTVLDVENGFPTRVAFDVEGGLDRVCFAEWRGNRLRTFHPPEESEPRIVVHELGPMGL